MWERQEKEPARWYARFEAFRLLGPARTMEAAFGQECATAGLCAGRPGQAWYQAAKQWRWRERAEAWDAEERERLRASEETRRFDGREKRMSMIAEMLVMVVDVIRLARLRNLSEEEARDALPVLRLLFKDLIVAERAEMGLPAVMEVTGAMEVTLTADDLAAAHKELKSFRLSLMAGCQEKEGIEHG